MATGDSVIRVTILGDAKALTAAIATADGKIKNFARTAGGALVGGFVAFRAIDAGFSTLQGGLDNADKLADSLTRIEGTTTPEFARQIHEIAFNMTEIGLSAPEVGNLAANFTDLATAAKVSEPTILAMTPQLLEIASAIAATTGKTVDEVISDIGKAAAGNQKAVSDYGIVVDKSLNPDARILDIVDQLILKFPDAKQAADDYAGAQEELGAKWDNFTTRLGEALEGPLAGVVDWMNDMADAIPGAIDGWGMLFNAISNGARTVLGPLGNVADVMRDIARMSPTVMGWAAAYGSGAAPFTSRNSPFGERSVIQSQRNFDDRNGTTAASRRIGGP
jgi:hypothetical protein